MPNWAQQGVATCCAHPMARRQLDRPRPIRDNKGDKLRSEELCFRQAREAPRLPDMVAKSAALELLHVWLRVHHDETRLIPRAREHL